MKFDGFRNNPSDKVMNIDEILAGIEPVIGEWFGSVLKLKNGHIRVSKIFYTDDDPFKGGEGFSACVYPEHPDYTDEYLLRVLWYPFIPNTRFSRN